MKLVIVLFAAIIGSILAKPQNPQANSEANAEVLKNELDNIGVGQYSYAYETSNGIQGQESGALQGTGETEGVEAQGSYSYTAPDGKRVSVTYTAGAGGYAPKVSFSR